MQPKVGGNLHLKLNIATRPIGNKYLKGKMKRTFIYRICLLECHSNTIVAVFDGSRA